MIAGILLAAGEGKRMGTAKQLLDWHGEPLIRHVARRIAGSQFDQIRVVLGACHEQIAPWIRDLGIEILINPDYRQGQSASLKKGLEGLDCRVTGAAFLLADQPCIQVKTYNRLIQTFQREEPGILIPTWRGGRGNPILFHQSFFSLLRNVEGDRGGREVIREHPDAVRYCEVDDPGIMMDLDVEEDYIRLLREEAELTL